MAAQKPREHIEYHAAGTIRGRGAMLGDQLDGYWEWYRKDGTKLRSGWFENGRQAGDWTTYDAKGKPYKVTRMKP